MSYADIFDYNTTCILYDPNGWTENDAGERIPDLTEVFNGYCFLVEQAVRQIINGVSMLVRNDYILLNPNHVSFDTIKNATQGTIGGRSYTVVFPNDIGDYGEMIQINIERVQNG